MSSIIRLQQVNSFKLPEQFKTDDVRTSDELIKLFINKFTYKGDNVFDLFLGYGTMVYIAEKMERKGYGIEYSSERANYARSLTENKCNIICGTSLELEVFSKFPLMDFSISSPPYMIENEISSYPFSPAPLELLYDTYLKKIRLAYKNLKSILKPNAYIVVEVCNIVHKDKFNTLAWDIAKVISEDYALKTEYIVEWIGDYRNSGFGLDHSYCFVFQNN